MLVFALGAGLLGAYLLARRHRRHHAWHHGWHHHRHGCGHHRHGHGGFGRGRRRWLLGRFFERLDATPAQERALVAERDALEGRLRTARGDLAALRPALGEALRSEHLDASATAGLEASLDAVVADVRAALADSVRKLHGLLDPQAARGGRRAARCAPSRGRAVPRVSRARMNRCGSLLIDDDQRLAELLVGYLGPQGVALTHAPGGQAGLAQLAGGGWDAVLLDVMMPGLDGLAVLRQLRTQAPRLPVIMLTARGDESDRVVGLELGADDYVAKPFSPRELLARLRAVVRRATPDALAERLTAAGIAIDVAAREAWVDGAPLELTALELDLLIALVRRAGRVVPRAVLLELAGRGDVAVGDRTVDVHVSRLRKKLGDAAAARVKTVRGVGYTLARSADEAP
jgi:two-component system OmpR family response regulator